MHAIAHRGWCMPLHTGADACHCTQVLMHAIAHRGCGRVCTESWLWKKRPLSHEGIKPTSVLHLSFWSSALATRSRLGVSCTSCRRCFALLVMSSNLQSTIISRSLVVGIYVCKCFMCHLKFLTCIMHPQTCRCILGRHMHACPKVKLKVRWEEWWIRSWLIAYHSWSLIKVACVHWVNGKY